MTTIRVLGLAFAIGALALAPTSASAGGSAPLFESGFTGGVTVGAADDLPAPPKLGTRPKAPKAGTYNNAFSCIPASCSLVQPPKTSRLEIYDFPGEYAQRFDGVEPGKPKPSRAGMPPRNHVTNPANRR